MDNSTTDQPKGGNGAASDGEQELIVRLRSSAAHCGTTLHGKELERGAQCRRRTDQPRLEGWGERKPPILPEYGTLNPPPSDPYAVRIGGVLADPARIARAYEIHDGMLFSALKKILRSGRKHKDRATDIREAITSLERWEAMNREDAQ